jgi:hypothetical protein
MKILVTGGAGFIASHIVDSPGIISYFKLNDSSSDRGNKREGYLSTLLKWDLN